MFQLSIYVEIYVCYNDRLSYSPDAIQRLKRGAEASQAGCAVAKRSG
jgi:hypothetical protein